MKKHGVKVIMVNGQVATFIGAKMDWWFEKAEVVAEAALKVADGNDINMGGENFIGIFKTVHVAGVYHI